MLRSDALFIFRLSLVIVHKALSVLGQSDADAMAYRAAIEKFPGPRFPTFDSLPFPDNFRALAL